MDDVRLEAALAELGGHVRFPELADQRAGVVARIAVRPARPWLALAPMRARLAAALAVVVLAVAGLLAVSPAARAFAEQILRLPGVIILRGTPPTPSPTASPSLDLGERVSLEEARRRAPYPLAVPADPLLGAPDAVYVRTSGPVTMVSFVYTSRAGIPTSPQAGVAAIVSEFDDAAVQGAILGKVVGPDTTITPVTVNGGNGYWLEGRPHAFYYQVRDQQTYVTEALRLAGNTLIWEQHGLVIRLEAQVDESTALRIAASLP